MAGGFPWRLVTVDIDGTLTRGHGWKEVAVAFDRLPAFEATNRRFRAREANEDEHLTALLNIATGHSVAEVEAVLARTPKLSGIPEGVARLHELGARVALLTHNPEYVADWYRRTFGFDGYECSKAQAVVDGRIGPAVGVRADKTGWLLRLLARWGVPAAATAHIGDGGSDAEVFALVGGGIALNAGDPDVVRRADLAITTDDFREVVRRLGSLTPRR